MDSTEKLLLDLCSVLPTRSFFRFLVTLTFSPFLNSPVTSFHCIYSILWFHKTICPIPLTKMSSTAFFIIDSSWLNLTKKNVRVNLKQYKWIFDINGFWYKRISVFRNIKEEPPHVAHLNSWRNCTCRCHWLCSKEDLLLNPCSMLPAHSMLTLSPFLNRNFISLFWVIFSMHPSDFWKIFNEMLSVLLLFEINISDNYFWSSRIWVNKQFVSSRLK